MAVDNGGGGGDGGAPRDDALLYVCNLQSPALPARIRYPAKAEHGFPPSGRLSHCHYESRKSESQFNAPRENADWNTSRWNTFSFDLRGCRVIILLDINRIGKFLEIIIRQTYKWRFMS